MDVRQVFKWIDDNSQQMEMYMQMNGQEVKTMEIKLTRNRHAASQIKKKTTSKEVVFFSLRRQLTALPVGG